MEPERSNLGSDAFGPIANAISVVHYSAAYNVNKALQRVLAVANGIAVLHGPAGSGKTVIVKQLAENLRDQTVVVVLNGTSIAPRQIVLSLLRELGCNVQLQSTEELLKLVHVIGVHRVRTSTPPILFVENIEKMKPGSLQMLCILAGFMTGERAAIRLILTGRDECIRVLNSQEMADIQCQVSCVVALGPMTSREVVNYLYARLVAVGVDRPDSILPLGACEYLYEQSGGWPRELNFRAQQLIESAAAFPARVPNSPETRTAGLQGSFKPPDLKKCTTGMSTLLISKAGHLIRREVMSGEKLIVGRSEVADVYLDDSFASKFHAILLRHDNFTIIVDLNSANGTYINSRKVQTAVLRNSDIVSIGNHRIKVEITAAPTIEFEERLSLSDTAKMKTLADERAIRRERAMLNILTHEKEA